MNLNGEFVNHTLFGRGQIIDVDESCVTVLFDTSEKKKFLYPTAIGTFLVLDNKQMGNQMQDYKDEIARNMALAHKEVEDQRQLEKAEKAKKPKKPAKKATKPKKQSDLLI